MAEGRCNCGSIKVFMPSMPEQSAICYCSNCRRAGGSMGSIIYPVKQSEVTINDAKGHLKSYEDSDTKSGNTITRQFCGNCGCPVASLVGDDKPMFLKGGLFKHIPVPVFKSFEEEEPSWMRVVKPGE